MRAMMVMAGILTLSGCAGSGLVAAQAANDLGCPEKEISVTSRDMGAYEARGCGKSQRYVVRGGEVMPDVGGD